MKITGYRIISILLFVACMAVVCKGSADFKPKTVVAIKGDDFYINGEITLKGRTLGNVSLEGLLPNSRMVQGIFDDLNPETRPLWKYPDTGNWDPDRNTSEFIAAMPLWRSHGLLAFTLNLQGGSPTGYGNNKGWVNPGFHKNGEPIREYFNRLEKILDKAAPV